MSNRSDVLQLIDEAIEAAEARLAEHEEELDGYRDEYYQTVILRETRLLFDQEADVLDLQNVDVLKDLAKIAAERVADAKLTRDQLVTARKTLERDIGFRQRLEKELDDIA